MKKFLKLVKNENIKEMKKISTKILIILAIASVILAVGFTMLIKFLNNVGTSFIGEEWQEYAKEDINYDKANLEVAKSNNNIQEIATLEAQVELKEYALKNNIDISYVINYDYWKIQIINDLMIQKANLNLYKLEGMPQEIINKLEEAVNNLYECLEEESFEKYIDIKIENIKNELEVGNITKEEYDKQLEILNLKKKYEIGKSNEEKDAWKYEVMTEIENIKEELRTSQDSTTKMILNYKQIEEKENTLKIDLYRLENNIASISITLGESNYRNFFGMVSEEFSMAFVAILVIMMAGSAISTEYSKGTIKFLVMTPNKRWKILFAKLVNIIAIMLAITILLSLITILVGAIFFSSYDVQPYLYVSGGEVHELNYFVYTILRFLSYDIDIVVYLLFALMLSVITRNTALSIGLSIASYLGSGMIMSILNMFVTADWIKFIPYNNMSLTEKIFTNTTTFMNTEEVNSVINNVPVSFSLCVLGVTAILMILTMFDSFNKRDIK